MVDALDVLFGDRAFIKVVGHIIGYCTDGLNTANERLMIWLRALKAWQRTMVNVDAAAGKRA